MKRFIKNIIIYTAPIWDPLYVLIYKTIYRISHPIPPFHNRRRVGNIPIKAFLTAGKNCYTPIQDAIHKYGAATNNSLDILDFGVGVGRTLRYFYDNPGRLYASDVDPSIEPYIREAFPSVILKINNDEPPLDYHPESFDVIYSVSVWTHLPYESQRPWLEEMHRLLKPAGLALITTSGFTALKLRQGRNSEWRDTTHEQLQKQGIIYKEYPHFSPNHKLNFPGIKRSYGLTAHSPAYIREQWSSIFSVVDIWEGVVDHVQDLVILRK